MDGKRSVTRRPVLPKRNAETRGRITSAPSSADPPKRATKITTLSIRRRTASGSALSRATDVQKVGTLCKFSQLNANCNAPFRVANQPDLCAVELTDILWKYRVANLLNSTYIN
ncbi:hypothetical protein Aduo_015576 [Ancylostoma duodenale]